MASLHDELEKAQATHDAILRLVCAIPLPPHLGAAKSHPVDYACLRTLASPHAAAVASLNTRPSWYRSGFRMSSKKGVWITCRPMSSPLTSVAGIKTHPRTPASRVPVRATTPTPTRFLSRIASTIAVNAAVELLVCGFCEPASAVDAAAPPPRYADPLLPPAPASPLGRINRAGRFVVCHRKRSSVSACVFSRKP